MVPQAMVPSPLWSCRTSKTTQKLDFTRQRWQLWRIALHMLSTHTGGYVGERWHSFWWSVGRGSCSVAGFRREKRRFGGYPPPRGWWRRRRQRDLPEFHRSSWHGYWLREDVTLSALLCSWVVLSALAGTVTSGGYVISSPSRARHRQLQSTLGTSHPMLWDAYDRLPTAKLAFLEGTVWI